MKKEAPRPTTEQIATGLVAQAIIAGREGKTKEIPVSSRTFINPPPLATRFKQLEHSNNPQLKEMIEKLLETDDKKAISYSSGINSDNVARYEQWVIPSEKYPGLFTLAEYAMTGVVKVAERSSILVSREDLANPRNWSRFFYHIILK